MAKLKCIPSAQLIYTASTVAVLLSKELEADELNILSSLLSSIGDMLALAAAQKQACSPDDENKS